MTVTITPTDAQDARRCAQRLLEAAGAEWHGEISTLGDGPAGVVFVVPADLAERVFGTRPAGGGEAGELGADEAGASGEVSASVGVASGAVVEASAEVSGEGPASAVAEASVPSVGEVGTAGAGLADPAPGRGRRTRSR